MPSLRMLARLRLVVSLRVSQRAASMSDLAEFLLARIAEDEAVARDATPGDWEAQAVGSEGYYVRAENPTGQRRRIVAARCTYEEWGPDRGNALHIARYDPARVLAECEAKRRIVEAVTSDCFTDGEFAGAHWAMSVLAAVYADHPDYRDEWKP